MSRHVRHTLLALAAGTCAQRVLTLLVTVWVMRHLGLVAFGEYAVGVQVAALLSLLADSGLRLLTAREIAAMPAHGVACLRASLRIRLRRSLVVAAIFLGLVSMCGQAPGFLLVCAALVPLAAFDLKQLADALGRAEQEVRFETVATIGHVLATGLVLALDGGLCALGLALVASRAAYAWLAWRWLRSLGGERAHTTWNLRHAGALGMAQLGYEVVFSSPVVVLRVLVGADAAGLMAAAQRIALAAETPVRLLARLVLPHLLHANRNGDPAATLERSVRAAAHLVLPIAAGGWVVATPLLELLSGAAFTGAAWALRWLLAASVVVGTLSHYSQALVARGTLRPYFVAVAVGITLDLALTLATVWSLGATGVALATAAASAAATATCLIALRRQVPFSPLRPWLRPAMHATLVTGAALAAQTGGVLLQLVLGAVAYALGLYWLELRGRARQVGVGLQRSSGFMADESDVAHRGEQTEPDATPTPEMVETGR